MRASTVQYAHHRILRHFATAVSSLSTRHEPNFTENKKEVFGREGKKEGERGKKHLLSCRVAEEREMKSEALRLLNSLRNQ